VDAISFFDFISDGIIIVQLVKSSDVMWMCLMITTVAWPYFVAQVPYLNFRLEHLRMVFIDTERRPIKKFGAFILLTPFILALFVTMDVLFLSTNLALTPIFLIMIIVFG
jgi:hypothetical protein